MFKKCCKQCSKPCRQVKLKGTMTQWPLPKQTHQTKWNLKTLTNKWLSTSKSETKDPILELLNIFN